jgi:hypothetical protein
MAYNAFLSWVRKMALELEEYAELLEERLNEPSKHSKHEEHLSARLAV